MKPSTMTRSHALYCPYTASFDSRLYTYNTLTKGKMAHPLQTAYSNSNVAYGFSWLTHEFTTTKVVGLIPDGFIGMFP
jgi:hypothetical protein